MKYPGPPRHQFNGHLQTILPAFRKIVVDYVRERIATPDGDFLDLDWLRKPEHRRLVILSHGLEGNSSRPYITAPARYFFERDWDALAWNCRSCSGEMNLTQKLYSHGQSEDLATVVNHAAGDYEQIILIGYSMGGNLTLKYLGTMAGKQPAAISHGIAFSSPCHIQHSVAALEYPGNWLYKRKFFRSLSAKMRAKEAQFPGLMDLSKLDQVKSWRDFDAWFSAPLNGFSGPDEFYRYASAANFMGETKVPVLLVNALNDPIIPRACTPHELKNYRMITIEEPRRGGHVGFHLRRNKLWSWMEERAERFVFERTV
ncbi:alpha/beta hydrolase [Lewinellaceae bacterium SD302]|nr:alpha/beta hydrolase [Lewinellaceae bacterium SD302]